VSCGDADAHDQWTEGAKGEEERAEEVGGDAADWAWGLSQVGSGGES